MSDERRRTRRAGRDAERRSPDPSRAPSRRAPRLDRERAGAVANGAPVESIDDYLAHLASSAPTPGGGSAAAVVGASAAALVAMVARVTLENKRLAAAHDLAAEIARDADRLRDDLLGARADDETAYGAVVAAQALPRTSEAERTVRTLAVQEALAGAASVPLYAAMLSRDVVLLAARALALGNAALASDLGCAAELGNAATAASGYSVRANHAYLADRELIATQGRELVHAMDESAEVRARIRAELATTSAFP